MPVGAARDRPARRAGADSEAHGPSRRYRGHRPQRVHGAARRQGLPAGRPRRPRALRGARAARRPGLAARPAALPRRPGRRRPDGAVAPDRAHGSRRVQLLRPAAVVRRGSAIRHAQPVDRLPRACAHRPRAGGGRRPRDHAACRLADPGPGLRCHRLAGAPRGATRAPGPSRPPQRGGACRQRGSVPARAARVPRSARARRTCARVAQSVRLRALGRAVSTERRQARDRSRCGRRGRRQ